MKYAAASLYVTLVFGLTAQGWGQPTLDQLEKDVRGLVDKGGGAGVGGGNGQSEHAPPAGEPGYLGVIADDRQEQGAGVRILELLPGGPADKAGLKAGDLVVEIEGQPVRSMADFAARMTGSAPGAKLKFNVNRDGKVQTVEVTLTRRPPPDQRPLGNFGRIPGPPPAEPMPTASRSLLGLRVVPVTDDARLALRLPQTRGALVVDVASGSAAQKASVPVEAVIVALNAQRVDTPDDLLRLVAEAGPGATIKLAYYSQGKLYERKITLDAVDVPRGQPAQPGAGRPVPFSAERVPGDPARIETLERRVQELEQRVAELERLLRVGGKPAAPELPKPDPSVP